MPVGLASCEGLAGITSEAMLDLGGESFMLSVLKGVESEAATS